MNRTAIANASPPSSPTGYRIEATVLAAPKDGREVSFPLWKGHEPVYRTLNAAMEFADQQTTHAVVCVRGRDEPVYDNGKSELRVPVSYDRDPLDYYGLDEFDHDDEEDDTAIDEPQEPVQGDLGDWWDRMHPDADDRQRFRERGTWDNNEILAGKDVALVATLIDCLEPIDKLSWVLSSLHGGNDYISQAADLSGLRHHKISECLRHASLILWQLVTREIQVPSKVCPKCGKWETGHDHKCPHGGEWCHDPAKEPCPKCTQIAKHANALLDQWLLDNFGMRRTTVETSPAASVRTDLDLSLAQAYAASAKAVLRASSKARDEEVSGHMQRLASALQSQADEMISGRIQEQES